ncbi:MAG: butyrate kinase [Clostridiales bacterium]|nr:butyrate kinase [Clostridiales bacterium]
MEKLLILNPGSTSTKIAYYEDENQIFVESIAHSADEVAKYDLIVDQYEFRKDMILDVLKDKGVVLEDLTAIVARGGVLPPIKAGAYLVNDDMVWQLRNKPVMQHASNLGAVIADAIAKPLGIPAYIYDGVTVDEMWPILKITGFTELERRGIGHNLNTRAAAMKYAREHDKAYKDCKLIVVHLGGGISITLQYGGKIADIINDEDGPFAPERSGKLPIQEFTSYFEETGMSAKDMLKKEKSRGGLVAHLGVNDSREVEKMIKAGDEHAKLIYDAMAMNVARCVGEEAATVAGDVEGIILTGGIAYSEYFTNQVKKNIEWIAPVTIYPGENEMESLALGGLRVLRGEEEASTFVKVE